MTREEAIQVLTDIKRIRSDEISEAVDMAIEALQGGDAMRNDRTYTQTPYMQQSPSNGADLISRADAIKAIRKCKFESVMPSDWYRGMECAQDIVKTLPSADRPSMIPIKLEKRYPHSKDEDITDAFMRGYMQGKSADRPQGEWILEDDDVKCSLCGSSALMRYIFEKEVGLQEYSNYCPNCGARMRGAE